MQGLNNMKFVSILYLCSMLTGQCNTSVITEHEFPTHFDCALAGYKVAHNTLATLDPGKVEENRWVVKFECKAVPIKKPIIPPKKPTKGLGT